VAIAHHSIQQEYLKIVSPQKQCHSLFIRALSTAGIEPLLDLLQLAAYKDTFGDRVPWLNPSFD